MGRLVCFTDDDAGLDDIVEARSLPATTMKAWWLKAYLFSDTGKFDGPGPLLRSGHGRLRRPREPNAARRGRARDAQDPAAMRNENRDHGYNSSVMAWTAPLYSEIWTLLNEPGRLRSSQIVCTEPLARDH